MPDISRAKLFGKLNSLCYKSMESAMVFCKLRGNPYVELVHILHQMLQLQDSDLHHVAKKYDLNPSRLAADITAALDSLPRGASSISDISQFITEAVEQAWTYATLKYDASSIRGGHLLVALVSKPNLKNHLRQVSAEFDKIKPDDLAENLSDAVSGSPEDALAAKDGSTVGGGAGPGEASGAVAPAQMGKEDAIKKFCKDLTEEARTGRIDQIVGRDEETRQVVDILMRRRQNNPILTGEAGVGKTAVVEGFAHRIVSGDVPPPMRDVRLLELDVAALQAGASMKGEFENRLKQVIEEIKASPKPIVLFIDEAHTLIGAGGASGTGDAAQLLKPALARGTLRTIAATTWAEYKKHIEKDPALTRRFQVVKVEEPTEQKAIIMMRKIAGALEKHHMVQLLDEAIESAVRLSHRYIPARQLPDKAVSLLDTACARVAIGQHAVPAEVEDSRRRIQAFDTEMEILAREQTVGVDHAARAAELQQAIDAEKDRLATLEERWQTEKGLVDTILGLRDKLRGPAQDKPVEGTGSAAETAAAGAATSPSAPPSGPAAPAPLSDGDRASLVAELKAAQAELAELQGDNPLILPSVDAQAVSAVVADWTGIPVGRMVKNELEAILKLAGTLNERVIGQRHALEQIARRIQTSRAGLENPAKPIGVFMLAGTSGVGKTETALALAESLYGGEQNLITINMSEYQEAHTVSTLKGAPPGYVGYGEGGVLTEAVRRRPYSVVLLDEVEKAHGDVHEIFFQVFDKGSMEDGEGRHIDFRNTIILLTTNVGTDLIMNMCKDPDLMPDPEALGKALREPMLKVFPAALLGRLVVIPFFPISDDMLDKITRLKLGHIGRRVRDSHKVPFTYDESVVKTVVSRCNERDSGARLVDNILSNSLLPAVSEEFLGRLVAGKPITKVHVSVGQDGNFVYSFD